MNRIQENVLGWAQALGSFFRPDPFIVSDVPEKFGSRDEIESAVNSLHKAEHLVSDELISGVFWARRPEGLPVEMSRPSLESIAKAIARQRGARLIISERIARGFLGIEERYSVETPHLVALSGVNETMTFGSREGKPLIIAEPVPSFVLAHETTLSHMIIQGFRRLIADKSDDAVDAAVHHAVFGMHPSLLMEHAALARLELDDPYKAILERLVREAGKHEEDGFAFPKTSAPPNWSPPEDFDGPTVAGAWRLVPAVISGIEYRVIFGGDLFGHPGLPYASRNWRSSPVIWIDEKLGWAKTYSRLYRLMPRQTSPASRS
jgi:hypothetical protein